MYKLLTRFSLAQKFTILGLIAFVMVSALAYILVSDANKDIDFVRQEIKGSVSIAPVMRMLQTVQQHRGMSSLVLSGKNEVIPSWDAKRKEADQAVEAIDATIKQFPELNLASNWHTVQGQWQQLKTDVAELSPQESFHRHTALVESIIRFVNLIADNSNITYDPTVESYEIGLIVSANMPMSTEFMGRLRAWGAILLGQNKASGVERASIDIYTGLAQYEFAKLNLSLDKVYAVTPKLESIFKASRQEMESKVKEALKLVNEQIVNSKKLDYPSQQYATTLTSAIDAQFAFSRVVNEQLQISLNAQASRLETKKYTILIIVVLLFALCVAVAMVVVRGILIQAQSITKALESIAQGDLHARTDMPHSSDEFVQIARSFDGMAAALQARQSEVARATARFTNIVDLAADAIISVDEEQRILIFNQGAERIFGYAAAEMLGQALDRLLPERYADAHRGHIRQFGTTPQTAHHMNNRSDIFGRRKDGSEFFAEANISWVMEDGKQVFTVFLRDITERKQAEEEIRQLNTELSQFKNTLDQTLECVFMFDPESLRFTYVNKGAMKQIGYSETELMQMTPVDIKPEFTLAQFQQVVQPLIDGVQPSLTFQTVHRHKDGHDVPVEVFLQLVRLEGQDPRFVAMVSDISERKQTEQRIAHMANHDALTDLPNRHLLQDRIQQALIHSRRNGNQGAVLFVDLDKFKFINDAMGHDVGDLLLKEVAHRLVSSLRSQDTVARTGGDEFIVVLHNVATAQNVGTMAQKLLDALLLPYRFAGKELHISASIGIAVFPDDGEDADTLLKNSDAAMYHAKEAGRNNCQFFARK